MAVLTGPDRAAGRGMKLQKSPVKLYAEAAGIPILQPQRLDRSAREVLRAHSPELLVVAAYGKIFGPRFLSLFPRGGVNLHPSLLPRYRGPAPIPAAILAGDRESGISIQAIDLKMDTGDILMQEGFEITPEADTLSISGYCAWRGAEMMLQVLEQMEAGTLKHHPQEEGEASYCNLIKKEDAVINWHAPCEVIDRAIRAYFPWPLAQTSWEGRGLNILAATPVAPIPTGAIPTDPLPTSQPGTQSSSLSEAANDGARSSEPGRVLGVDKNRGILVQTGEGILALRRLQLQAKKAMDWKSFINGNRHIISALLGG